MAPPGGEKGKENGKMEKKRRNIGLKIAQGKEENVNCKGERYDNEQRIFFFFFFVTSY